MASIAVLGAIDVSLCRHEGPVNQRRLTEAARVAGGVAVPTQGTVLVDSDTHADRLTAGYAARAEQLLVTAEEGQI